MQTKDRESGAETPVAPDRKVYGRLIDAAVEAGELVCMSITFPAVHGSLNNRSHTVLARPGTQHDEELVNKVWNHYREYQKRLRGKTHIQKLVQEAEMRGEELPVVAPQPLLANNQSLQVNKSEAALRFAKNGLISARMARVRIVHEVACAVAEQRRNILQDVPEQQEEGNEGQAEGTKMFVITMVPGSNGVAAALQAPKVETVTSMQDIKR